MRIRRVLGAVFLVAALLLPVLRRLFREPWRRLHFERGWEWTFEHPEYLWVAGLVSLAAGLVLLVRDARKRPVISVLIGLGGCLLAVLYFLMLSLPPGSNRRVVRFPDPGRFAEAVALTSGISEITFDIYVRHAPGGRMQRWGELDYQPGRWPFEMHRSPGQPRYLIVDSKGWPVVVIDLAGDAPSGGEWRGMDVDALQDEFGVTVPGIHDPDPIRVMTFNSRYDNPGDGENRWELRKDLVVDTIRDFDPDLLGLQEVLDHQGRFIRESLEGYGFVGVGRDDGVAAGEFAPVMYRKKRFELLDSGHFWLSETPEVPGSMGWDAACCRIATWARLRDRQAGRAILVLNTHWDHRGAKARLESAKQVKRFLDAQNDPVVVTGDFNAGFRSPPLKVLRESLVDAWRKSQKRPVVEAGTFHGFDGKDTGARIDWILCSEDFRPNSGTIDRTSRDGRYPSDHFPVTAVLSISPDR